MSRRAARRVVLGAGLLAAVPVLGASEVPPSDAALLSAMRTELERSMKELALPGAPSPYYMGYWVVDTTDRTIEATLGALVSDGTVSERFVKVDLRVGSRTFDNSNFTGGGGGDDDFVQVMNEASPRPAPLEGDAGVLRHELWLATDAAYKTAVETLEQKRAGKQSQIAARSEAPSFSDEVTPSLVAPEPPRLTETDLAQLATRVSAVFRGFPQVQRSEVHVLSSSVRRRFVASDGGFAVEPSAFTGLEITAQTQADDGMLLERSTFLSPRRGAPLAEEPARAEAKRLGAELVELRAAPVTDDYTGPVLFEGRAAAQLAYELLGESLSGTPPPSGNAELEGPFSRRLGKRVLPRGFTVVDDPTLTNLDGVPLLGHYSVDDEGMAGERASLVEDGHLRSLLMSRTPREGILRSNGHGRSGLVGWARGRPGNLLISAKGGLPKRELRARLLDAARDEGEGYGLVVTELETRTGATSGTMVPSPQMIYRVTPDGKETLLRGATLAPISVRELRDVLGAGRDATVFSFIEESDGGLDIPVSVAAPALLFEEIEVRGPVGPNKKPPVVPRPPMDPGGR